MLFRSASSAHWIWIHGGGSAAWTAFAQMFPKAVSRMNGVARITARRTTWEQVLRGGAVAANRLNR